LEAEIDGRKAQANALFVTPAWAPTMLCLRHSFTLYAWSSPKYICIHAHVHEYIGLSVRYSLCALADYEENETLFRLPNRLKERILAF